MLQERAGHEAIQAARQRQQTTEFTAEYVRRGGVDGTLSQGIRALDLRRARYRGLAKTYLQHLASAAAPNVRRLVNWLNEVPAPRPAAPGSPHSRRPADGYPMPGSRGREFASGI